LLGLLLGPPLLVPNRLVALVFVMVAGGQTVQP
jgi:hypothetical protein